MRALLPLLLFSSLSFAAFEPNRILFLLTQGQVETAVEYYEEREKQEGKHDFELLRQMSLVILDQTFKSNEPEKEIMAIFGAGISTNDAAFYLLEEGMRSKHPEIQVIALNFLGKSGSDRAYELIQRALGSPFGLIRLEAAYQLALIKHKRATAQLEALMQKIDPRAIPLFPQLFALVGDDASIKILRKLLSHTDTEVRIASIATASSLHRDDLLPQIRRLALQHDARQKEACAFALGEFQDTSSKELLERLTQAKERPVRIGALLGLYQLGDKNARIQLEALASEGDLFAIRALGKVEGSKDLLVNIMQSSSLQHRVNATLSLLELKDRRALPGLKEILVRDAKDLAFVEIPSPGKALFAIRAVPSLTEKLEDNPLLHELSLAFKESVLTLAVELPEKDFLRLARLLFDTHQNELIPTLVELLVNMDTEGAIALLKFEQQQVGAPLIRNYATLGLVKLKEEGPYLETVRNFALQQTEVDIMRFRTFVPFEKREVLTTFELTPEESARLLIESLEVLGEADEDGGLDLLLSVLKNGHPKNRPVIAGLILRSAN